MEIDGSFELEIFLTKVDPLPLIKKDYNNKASGVVNVITGRGPLCTKHVIPPKFIEVSLLGWDGKVVLKKINHLSLWWDAPKHDWEPVIAAVWRFSL